MIWLLLYSLLLCLISLWSHAKERTKAHMHTAFFVNNRQSSANGVAFSIVASCVGGSATLGMAGLAWQVGMPAFWWLGTGAIGLTILAFFLAHRVRQSGAYTLPEMISTFLSPSARPLSSVIIILAWLAITSAQLSAMAALISPLIPEAIAGLPTPIANTLQSFEPSTLALLLGSSIVVIYACIGGQAAVIKSDLIQYALLMLALIVSVGLLYININTADLQNPLSSIEFELINAEFPLSKFTYFLLIVGGSYVVCPMLFGRLYSAKDANTAKRGAMLAIFWLLLTAMLIVALGIICRAFTPELTNIAPEKVLSTVLLQELPAWASTLAFLGIFSALISSADSSLITAATICSNDVLRTHSVKVCRLCTICIGLGGVALALSGKGILQLLLMANDIYVCGIVTPVFVGMLAHKRYILRARGITLAMGMGGAFGLTAALSGENIYSYMGIITALIISLLSIKGLSIKKSQQLNAH